LRSFRLGRLSAETQEKRGEKFLEVKFGKLREVRFFKGGKVRGGVRPKRGYRGERDNMKGYPMGVKPTP